MKLARMPYINVDPFYYTIENGSTPPDVELVTGYPRQIGRLADRESAIDAAPISVMDYLGLQQTYEPLGRMCVAVKEKAGSVNLFSRLPADRLDGRRIGITSQTSTSKVLMRLILERRYGVKSAVYLDAPEFGDVDAYLLIGNNALVHAHNGLEGFDRMYDLGEEWYNWTGLPFVFALWAVRKAAPERGKRYLRDLLGHSLEAFWDNQRAMAQRRAGELLIPAGAIESYWRLFVYNRTPAVDKSLELFIHYIKGVQADGQK